jgi:hypothetical protein
MEEINNWDLVNNFWVVNPHFKAIELYNEVLKNDTSKGKTQSSILMWGIAYYASFYSKLKQLGEKERMALIAKDILKDPSFDWKSVDNLVKGWDIFKSVSMKQMTEWDRLMNEKTDFMRTLKYDGSTADTIEKLLLSNSKLYKEYEDIMERLGQETNGGVIKGGSVESLSEQGAI